MKESVLFLIFIFSLIPSFAQKASDYIDCANKGDADCQYLFGWCYERGNGVQQDYNKAVYWYEKAAEQGVA